MFLGSCFGIVNSGQMHFYFVSLPNSMGEMIIVKAPVSGERYRQQQNYNACPFLHTLEPTVNVLVFHLFLCFSVQAKPVMLLGVGSSRFSAQDAEGAGSAEAPL